MSNQPQGPGVMAAPVFVSYLLPHDRRGDSTVGESQSGRRQQQGRGLGQFIVLGCIV